MKVKEKVKEFWDTSKWFVVGVVGSAALVGYGYVLGKNLSEIKVNVGLAKVFIADPELKPRFDAAVKKAIEMNKNRK